MPIKATIAAFATPPVRLVARHVPSSRRWLWNRVINPHLSWREYAFVAKTRFGAIMAGETRDVIQRYIYYFGMWEPNVEAFLCARLRSGDTFVDVGANIGYFTLLGAKLAGPRGRVVAIEASTESTKQLKANIARNNLESVVRTVQAAASDREGMTNLYEGEAGNSGSASIVRSEGHISESVRSAPLEKLLLPHEIESVRVIKIDVEGAETLVFRGLQPLMSSLRSDAEIVMEITPDCADGIVGTLAQEGWTAYALEPKDSIENYFARTEAPHAARLVGPVVSRTDVVFSRLATERISYNFGDS